MDHTEQTPIPVTGFTPIKRNEPRASDTSDNPPAGEGPVSRWTPLRASLAPTSVATQAPTPVISWRPVGPRTPPPAIPGLAARAPSLVIAFHPGPREYPDDAADHIELLDPGDPPDSPQLGQVLISSMVAVGSALLLFLSQGHDRLDFLQTLLPILFSTSVLTGLGTGAYQAYVYFSKKQKRETWYRKHLYECRARLEPLREKQRNGSLVIHPEPLDCIERAEQRSSHLWERSLSDRRQDFLDMRVGRGEVPPIFDIGPKPPQGGPLERDALLDEARELVNEYAEKIRDAPIVVPLVQAGVAGLIGSSPQRNDVLRAMIVQLATHHPPDELKIVIFAPRDEESSVTWMQHLPHTWDDDDTCQFVNAGDDAAAAAIDWLDRHLRSKGREYPQNTQKMKPSFVMIFSDPALAFRLESAGSASLLDLLIRQGPSLGAYGLFCAERPEQLPNRCVEWLDISAGPHLHTMGPPRLQVPVTPDELSLDLAERFGRAMALLQGP